MQEHQRGRHLTRHAHAILQMWAQSGRREWQTRVRGRLMPEAQCDDSCLFIKTPKSTSIV